MDNQQGVAGNGLNNDATKINTEYIGDCEVIDHLGGPWSVLGEYKKTACGSLVAKSLGIDYDDDRDLEGYIILEDIFDYLVSESDRPAGHTNYKDDPYNSDDTTIHFEYALYKTEYPDNSTIPENIILNEESILKVNENICVYGAWVTDEEHCNNGCSPEIHPTQQIWQVTEQSSTIRNYDLFFIKDKSGRYESLTDYGCEDDVMKKRIWLEEPLTSSFYIAFQMNIGGAHSYNYYLTKDFDESLVPTTCSPGRLHQLVYLNKVLLTFDTNNLDNYDISFRNVRVTADNKIIGYIKITTSIGEGEDITKSGCAFIHVLRIRNDNRISYNENYELRLKSIKRIPDDGINKSEKYKGFFMLTEGNQTYSYKLSINENETELINSTSIARNFYDILLNKTNETNKIINAYLFSNNKLSTCRLTLVDEINGLSFTDHPESDFDDAEVTKTLIFMESINDNDYVVDGNQKLLTLEITFTLKKHKELVSSAEEGDR